MFPESLFAVLPSMWWRSVFGAPHGQGGFRGKARSARVLPPFVETASPLHAWCSAPKRAGDFLVRISTLWRQAKEQKRGGLCDGRT